MVGFSFYVRVKNAEKNFKTVNVMCIDKKLLQLHSLCSLICCRNVATSSLQVAIFQLLAVCTYGVTPRRDCKLWPALGQLLLPTAFAFLGRIALRSLLAVEILLANAHLRPAFRLPIMQVVP